MHAFVIVHLWRSQISIYLTILLLLSVWIVNLKIFDCVELLAEDITSKIIKPPFRSTVYFNKGLTSSRCKIILQNLVYAFLSVCVCVRVCL